MNSCTSLRDCVRFFKKKWVKMISELQLGDSATQYLLQLPDVREKNATRDFDDGERGILINSRP